MENIINQIEFINISKGTEKDLFSWTKSGNSISKYKLDILVAKDIAKTDDFFYQMQRHNLKISCIKQNNILFIIGANETIQFQLLEAFMDEISARFSTYYMEIMELYSGDFPDGLNEFYSVIEEINSGIQRKIKFFKVTCKICNKPHTVCVKNSLIEKSKEFPVSVVYLHSDHGLLIYIDAFFKIRGEEAVKIIT